MQHIQGGDRNQTLLLPVAVDDYVGRENPVRFIEAFVDQCDLQEAGFRRVQPKDTGRRAQLAAYHAGEISYAEFDASIQGWINHVRHADSWGLRRHVLETLAIRPAEHRRAVEAR